MDAAIRTKGLTIATVGADKALAAEFVDVPRRLYAGDPRWVPPLRAEALKALDRRRNPFHRYADIEHFVLHDGEAAVGRIAATIYPPHVERYGDVGFFGFFESPDDPHAAGLLLTTAEEWLAARGMTRVAGPYNYVSTQELGMLIEGFDQAPAVFQTYNPPWYPALVESAGYSVQHRMYTVHWTAAEHAGMRDAVAQAGDAALARAGLAVRPLNRRRYMRDMQTLREIFNAAFAENDDVLPYEGDVFAAMVKPLKPLVDPSLIRFLVRPDGREVAFTAIVPDVNVLLRELDGRLRLRDLLRVRSMAKRNTAAVMLIIGSLPETRGEGLGAALVSEMVKGLVDGGYQLVHTTWIHEDNPMTAALVAHWNVAPDKRYAIYAKDL